MGDVFVFFTLGIWATYFKDSVDMLGDLPHRCGCSHPLSKVQIVMPFFFFFLK